MITSSSSLLPCLPHVRPFPSNIPREADYGEVRWVRRGGRSEKVNGGIPPTSTKYYGRDTPPPYPLPYPVPSTPNPHLGPLSALDITA